MTTRYTNLQPGEYSLYENDGYWWLYRNSLTDDGGYPDIPITQLCDAAAMAAMPPVRRRQFLDGMMVALNIYGHDVFDAGYKAAQADMRTALGLPPEGEA